jgi:GxxExxY protein
MTWASVTYKHQELTQLILGVFDEVYNELGHGFLESVYQEAMVVAPRQRGAMGEGQSPLPVWFRGERIGDFRADLIVGNAVIVELKAGRDLEPVHDAQWLNYLRASELEVGLLLNFGPAPKIKRPVFATEKKRNLRLSA